MLLHLADADLLPVFAPFLTPIADCVDLFVISPAAGDARFRKAVTATLPSARLVATEAQDGAAAFLDTLMRVDLSRYVAVCKLHGDAIDADDEVRRAAMLRTLLGSRALIEEIAAAFRFDDDVWLVGPADLYVSTRAFVGAGTRAVLRLAGDLYPHVWPDRDWGFFAGGMFWFRPVAMERLTEAFGAATFDQAAIAATEHVFALACAVEGKKVGRTRLAADASAPETLVVEAASAVSRVAPAVTLGRLARTLEPARARTMRPPPRLAAPPTVTALRKTGVNIIGPLGFVSGLGTSARGYQRLLEEAGVAVNGIDWEDGFARLSRARARAPRTDTPAPVNIVHINLDLLAEGRFLERGDLADRLARARTNILVFYWELPKLLPEWASLIARFDEVWCPSRFIERAVHASTNVPTRLLRPELRIARAMRRKPDRARLNLPHDRFVFAYIADGGSILARKNPKALIEAFCAEFREDEGACCYLKIHYQGGEGSADLDEILWRIEDRADIVLCRDLFDDATMDVLFQSIDCYVSPHRSEGLGLTILEAMQHGKPIIATPFGGAADVVTEATAYPLAYDLAAVGPGAAPYPEDAVWAEPSIASLRRQMRRVFDDRRGAAQRSAAAARHVADMFAGNAEAAAAIAGPSPARHETRVSA